jgi:hypothetical protein
MTPTIDSQNEIGQTVTVSNGTLSVNHWVTTVPEIIKYFEERADKATGGSREELGTLLEHALRMGVLGLRAVGLTVNVDYVEREFQRFITQAQAEFDQRVQRVVGALETVFASDGELDKALKLYLGEGGKLMDLFDPDRRDSAIGKIQALLDVHFDGKGSKIHRLLDATDPDSPLHRLQENMLNEFEKLRKQIEEYRVGVEAKQAAGTARADALEKSALKGRSYEELLFDVIVGIAKHFGDSAESTGDQSGVSGAKVGDVVVTIASRDAGGTPARMVFEAKDRMLGLTGIIRELEAGKQNRGAISAVAVYSRPEYMPTGTEPFHECGPNLFLVLYEKERPEIEALQLAYRAARYWTLKTSARTPGGAVDAAKLRENVDAARRLLGAFTAVRAQLTQLRNAVEKGTDGVDEQLTRLRDELQRTFDQMDQNLGK